MERCDSINKKPNKTAHPTAGNVSIFNSGFLPRRRWPISLGKKMKISINTSEEFSSLATTRYQRYVLHRLEYASTTNPLKPFVAWILIMIIGSIGALTFRDLWWYYLAMTIIFGSVICEIYFSRAVLAMMRNLRNKESTNAQQAAPSNR